MKFPIIINVLTSINQTQIYATKKPKPNYLRHSGIVSDHVPFGLQVRLSGPNRTKPSWQVNVTSSPGRYSITALPTLPFLGLPGNPQESPNSI